MLLSVTESTVTEFDPKNMAKFVNTNQNWNELRKWKGVPKMGNLQKFNFKKLLTTIFSQKYCFIEQSGKTKKVCQSLNYSEIQL